MSVDGVIVCDQCDLVQLEVELELGGKAYCIRCENDLYRCQPDGLRRSLIFSLTAAALFLISNSFPIVSIDSQGLTNSTTLLEAADRLIRDDLPSIAVLVFATTFLMPALEIMSLIYLLLPLHFGRLPPRFNLAYRLIHLVKPWAMIEVFMLGLLVTISKLNAFATVVPDIGLISFILLMFSITASAANFDDRTFWKLVNAVRKGQA
ncbi:paraquat-inducible protein A [Polynucleobacter sp. JS-Safj-400b-B2]|uniref:paraquat-inducible protein A n=1 Tax=Polynucleobacter sp. JS-Safj-400b-B2 TaxID=2576921 RepID=UPI001C0B91F9|nr:paraquat-inducible protein A [Polynucleobacter sp. JS-Safj-400b-B2]MBU3627075.1 paraquat-inducible protein A [Polynucleobacter sp. JS-Safj-400b-B2]